MFYKNLSHSAKTFHGVTFKPGEVKEVDAFINSLFMVPVEAPKQKPEKKEEKKETKKVISEEQVISSKCSDNDNKEDKQNG